MNLGQLIESLTELQKLVGADASTNCTSVNSCGVWRDARETYSHYSKPDYKLGWTVRVDALEDRAQPDIGSDLQEIKDILRGREQFDQTKPVRFEAAIAPKQRPNGWEPT